MKWRQIQSNAQTLELQKLLVPLMQEFKSLRESVDSKYDRLESKYAQLEEAINSQGTEVSSELHKIKDTISDQNLN